MAKNEGGPVGIARALSQLSSPGSLMHTADPKLYPPYPESPRREVVLPTCETRQLDIGIMADILGCINPVAVDSIKTLPNKPNAQRTADWIRQQPEAHNTVRSIVDWAMQPDDEVVAYQMEYRQHIPPSWGETHRQHVKTLYRILKWGSDPETRRHFRPAPPLIDIHSPHQFVEALSDLTLYYLNYEVAYDSKTRQYAHTVTPEKISPLVTYDEDNEPVGVVTIRWRGDPYMPPSASRTASLERLMVAREHWGNGYGTALIREVSNEALARGFEFVHTWVMINDAKFGRYDLVLNLFASELYRPHATQPLWKDYARKRRIPLEEGTEDDESLRLVLNLKDYKKFHDQFLKALN